jgi:hypothetical protein
VLQPTAQPSEEKAVILTDHLIFLQKKEFLVSNRYLRYLERLLHTCIAISGVDFCLNQIRFNAIHGSRTDLGQHAESYGQVAAKAQ